MEALRALKVCSSHFKPTDFKDSIYNACSANPTAKRRYLKLKDGTVPSIFPWSTSATQSSSSSSASVSASALKSAMSEPVIQSAVETDEPGPKPMSSKTGTTQPLTIAYDVPDIEMGRADEVISYEVVHETAGQEETTQTDDDVFIEIVQSVNVGLQTQAEVVEHGAQTRHSGAIKSSFSIKDIKDDPEAIKFYTSFESNEHFEYVLFSLRPNAYELDYKSRSLDTEYEFFLFMMKIRLNHEDQDIAELSESLHCSRCISVLILCPNIAES